MSVERGDRPALRDTGIRSRRTDVIRRGGSPHESLDWTSTYHLRWADHEDQARQSSPRAA